MPRIYDGNAMRVYASVEPFGRVAQVAREPLRRHRRRGEDDRRPSDARASIAAVPKHKRTRIENLSVDDLVRAAELALANAEELRGEAALLADHGCSPRAYALAHMALEELSKITMTVRLARDLRAGMDVDWPKFSRRFRDHSEKVTAHATADYLYSEIRADNSDVAAYLEDLERVPDQLARRNASLYVDFDGSKFVAPSESVSTAETSALLDYLDPRLDYYRRTLPPIAAAIRKAPSEQERATYRALRRATDSMWRAQSEA